jgi:hypothetical protein
MVRTEHTGEDLPMRNLIWIGVALFLVTCVVDGDVEAPEDDGGLADAAGEDAGDAAPMMMGGCETADDCPTARPACAITEDGDDNRCVECTDSTFCESTEVCGRDFDCVATMGVCREPFDCPAERALCALFVSGEIGVCVECAADDDCDGDRPACATNGDCVPAGARTECEERDPCGPLRACVEGACVEA